MIKRYLASGTLLAVLMSSLLFSTMVTADEQPPADTDFLQKTETTNKANIELPRQPRIWEIYDVNKENFQADRVLESPPPELLERYIQAPLKTFPGFFGYYATSTITGNSLQIIEPSLTISTEGLWEAMGLVRNETLETVGNIEIIAELYDSKDQLLERVSALTLVEGIRSGEPAPFQVRSTQEHNTVARVIWQAKPVVAEGFVRELHIRVSFNTPYGSKYIDGKPMSYLLGTSFRNLEKRLNTAKIVVAWLNEEKRVIWIEERPIASYYTEEIPPKRSVIFEDIVVSDPEIGSKISRASYTMWAVGK